MHNVTVTETKDLCINTAAADINEREACLRLLIVLLCVIVTQITDLYINTAAVDIRVKGSAFGFLLL